MTLLRVFVGYDHREPVAYHVLAHSILMRASEPVAVIPLRMDTLREQGLYWRARDERAATEFSLTRFLVPALCGYEGWALFLDCDMVVRGDLVGDLKPLLNAHQGVFVCPHDYIPKDAVKMDGQRNEAYPKKNWSSMMVFNAAQCRALTPDYVNTATPAELHRFQWCAESAVGHLPLEWNWLVGEYAPNPTAKILHYTLGGPWFRDTAECDHAEDWRAEYRAMLTPPVEHYSQLAWHKLEAIP